MEDANICRQAYQTQIFPTCRLMAKDVVRIPFTSINDDEELVLGYI
jgi:hypothetical protein